MAIKSGRVGVRHDQVDHYGRIKNVAGGIYSNLSAGSLVYSESAENSKVNTHSSFTGQIDLTSIKGNMIKWNQLLKSSSVTSIVNGITFTNNNDGSWAVSGTATATAQKAITTDVDRIPAISGHKYLMLGALPDGGSTKWLMQLYRTNAGTLVGTDNGKGLFYTADSETVNLSVYFTVYNGNTVNGKIYPQIFDLTQMFGAGNEPATVEQFKSMFPLDYYEYDTGSLLPFKASVLQNVFTGEEIHLPTLTYFPTGMKSAGSVYDELTESKAITRIGAIDLGSLTWQYGANLQYFYTNISNIKSGTDNVVCSLYENSHSTTITTVGNMQFMIYENEIRIKNSAYTDATAFKTAMNGVYLYYELATPIEIDIDVDFNLSLNVNEGENLQLLPLGTDTPASAPLRASVTSYKSGATGNDVEKLLGSIAQVETSPATGNHSVGDYIMYNYQLYKVTASITTGGSLVVGTNITATTVMDEFKTL